MSKWTNTKTIDNSNVKVVGVERGILDTNPDLYCDRGQAFFKQKNYTAAEQEYLRAVKFSGKDLKYVKKLLYFYYATCNKNYEKKADLIYKQWYSKNALSIQFGKIYELLAIGYCGILGILIDTLIMFVIPFLGLILMSRPRISFIHSARKKIGIYTFKSIVTAFIGIVIVAMYMMTIYGSGTIMGFNLPSEYFAIRCLSIFIGVVSGIIGLVRLNKFVSNLEKKSKKEFVKNLLKKVRVFGIIILIIVAVALLINSLEETKMLFKWKKDSNESFIFYNEEINIDNRHENRYYGQNAGNKMIIVPNVVGMTPEEAKIVLEARGLYIGEQSEYYSAYYDTGEIMSQTPDAGQKVSIGEPVKITVVLESRNPNYKDNSNENIYEEEIAYSNTKTGLYCYEAEFGQYRLVVKEVSKESVVFSAGYVGWNECFSNEIIGKRVGDKYLFEYSIGFNEVDGDGSLQFCDGYILVKFNDNSGSSRNFLSTTSKIKMEWVSDSTDIYSDENKAYVASVVGCKESNLWSYDDELMLKEYVVAFQYVDDYGGAADFLLVLLKDGTVVEYYSDGTYTIINNS